MPLHGKTAVVTGASGGIGRAIALELAHAGAAVAVHYRSNREAADALVDEILSSESLAIALQADLTQPDQLKRLHDQAWQWCSDINSASDLDSDLDSDPGSENENGGIDIWVNNAGADILTEPLRDLGFDDKLAALLDVDLKATIALSRVVGHSMQARVRHQQSFGHAEPHGAASIINIGWDGATRGMAGDSAQLFAAAKGAVMAFTRSLAQSLAPDVRVNCIAPGWIKTAWAEKASDAWQQRAVDESLMARWGEPVDVARAVRFLVSDDAGMINAQTLEVNGGFRLG